MPKYDIKVLSYEDNLYLYSRQHNKTTQVDLTQALAAIRESDTPEIILTSRNQPAGDLKLLLGVITKERFQTRTKKPLVLSINPRGELDAKVVRTKRWFAGATEGLYRFLLSPTRHFAKQHPAAEAMEFLVANGVPRSKLIACVASLGDIVFPFTYARDHEDYLIKTVTTALCVEGFHGLTIAAADYLQGSNDHPWFTALWANRPPYAKVEDSAPIMARMLWNRGDASAHSVAHGVLAVLKLIVGKWLAVEYHPDLLSSTHSEPVLTTSCCMKNSGSLSPRDYVLAKRHFGMMRLYDPRLLWRSGT